MTKQPVTVELYYSGAWNPAPVYVRDPITITRGKRDESSGLTPASASLSVSNRTGDYNPRNPLSSLYGLIGRNTPIRIGNTLDEDPFTRTVSGGWGFTPGGRAWGASTPAATSVTSGKGVIAQTANTISYVSLSGDLVDVEQTIDVETSAMVTGAALVVGLMARRTAGGDCYWLRAEFNPGVSTVTLKVSKWVSGSLIELGSLIPVPGLTYAANTPLRVAATVTGPHLGISVWNPATDDQPLGWQLEAVDTTLTAAGLAGVMTWCVAGNTNVSLAARVDNYQLVDRRFYGEVASWRPGRTVDFDSATGRGDAWTAIEAAGILRRLSQGADVIDSPLRRAIGDAGPSAYWPLEDLDGATAAASAVDGVDPMLPFGFSRFTAPGTGDPVPAAGLPKFGTGQGIPGSAPVVDLTQGGVLAGTVPPGDGTSWRVEWTMVAPRDKAAAVIPIRILTDGTWDTWDVQIQSTGLFGTFGTGLSAAGSASVSFAVFDGRAHHYAVEVTAAGGGLVYAVVIVDGVAVGVYSPFIGSMVGSAGNVVSVVVNPLEVRANETAAASMPVLGHVAVWNPYPAAGPPDTYVAAFGHIGEATTTRFARLCAEQGITATVIGQAADAPTMGPQRVARLVDLLTEIEQTDDGLIYEPRDGLGLVLRTGASLAGQPPALVAVYSAEQVAPPLDPVIDDQGTRNDVTATSTTTGATARAVLTAGPMSVLPPPDGVGRAETRVDVNPADDVRLADYAGWNLLKGTVDEVRFASLAVDLVASPDLVAAAAAVDVGDRVDVTGLPVDVAPGEVHLIAPGYTEVIGSHTRRITVNAIPYGPYEQVATADGDPRAPADGSTLAAGITSSALSLSLASTAANGVWTTDPADFPMDLRVGGERVTATAITGASSPQTVNLSARAVNGVGRAWPAGTEVDVWTPAVAAL